MAEKDAWVRTFDQSFDDPVRPELERIEAEERDGEYAHNPRLVEPLLGEIAALIDRCLAYRREGAELELEGVSQALDRLLSEQVQDLDRRLLAADMTRSLAEPLARDLPGVVVHNRPGPGPENDFAKCMTKDASGVFRVDLSNYFSGMNHVRLRAVGASFVASKDTLEKPEYGSARLRLNVATVDEATRSGQIGKPEVVALRSVGAFSPSVPVACVQGSSMYNVDPRRGWWVKVKKGGWTGTSLQVDRDSWIVGIVLHFPVVTAPVPYAEGWITGDF